MTVPLACDFMEADFMEKRLSSPFDVGSGINLKSFMKCFVPAEPSLQPLHLLSLLFVGPVGGGVCVWLFFPCIYLLGKEHCEPTLCMHGQRTACRSVSPLPGGC